LGSEDPEEYLYAHGAYGVKFHRLSGSNKNYPEISRTENKTLSP
jgi:hypothetical protein